MMHGSAFDRFDELEDDFDDDGQNGNYQYERTSSSRVRNGGGGGGGGGGRVRVERGGGGGGREGGGVRVVREERRERRTHGSPGRSKSGGRRNVSPRRKAQSGGRRTTASGEYRSERAHRSPRRDASPRRRPDRYVQEEYYQDNGFPEPPRRSSKSTRTSATTSRSQANHNGPIMDYDYDDLADDFQTVKVSRNGRDVQDGGHMTGTSSRSRNGVVTPSQVEDHQVEYVDDDDFDTDLQYVRKPSPRMSRMMGHPGKMKGGKKFLRDVQDELEEQRTQWEDEVDKLSQGTLLRGVPKAAQAEGTNSFVDMSTGAPIFKAFFDVSEYPKRGIAVSVDKLHSKIIVKGTHPGGGTLTRTFTQKVQLPKFADDQRMRTTVSRNGILKVELPLIYYFPAEKNAEKKPRSFVNEIRTRRDGTQVLEILANAGTDVKARDLKVNVTEDNELVITAAGGKQTRRNGEAAVSTVKRYTLPSFADLDNITSKLGKDGRLVVRVPLRRKALD